MIRDIRRTLGFAIAAFLLAAGGGFLSHRCARDPIPRADSLPALAEDAPIDDMHLEILDLDTTLWVERWSPADSSAGYNLVLYRRRVPMLVDMLGRVVHVWPTVRAVGRVRLNRHGDLLVIGVDNRIKVYDWGGVLRFAHPLPPGLLPHHDVRWSRNGNLLVLGVTERDRRDTIREVSYAGEVVWEWDRPQEISGHLIGPSSDPEDPTHINSIQELPLNPLYDGGDLRFRPGNLLLSVRNMNALVVVERSTGEIVWTYQSQLDHQHEAIMMPKGSARAGRIMFFDNGLTNRRSYRQSRVVEIDPQTGRATWVYQSPYFYSSVGGTHQPLPNGNVLITASQGGRVFEVTREGEIVWQWTPPYMPMRARRYSYDFSELFARLDRAPPSPIESRLARPFIDRELHGFAVPGEFTNEIVLGEEREVMSSDVRCRELLVPPEPTLHVGYGFRSPSPQRGAAVEIVLSARALGEDDARTLVEDSVPWTDEPGWHARAADVPFQAFERVELCLERSVRPGAEIAASDLVVENPRIETADSIPIPHALRHRSLSDEERALMDAQLRALGYVN